VWAGVDVGGRRKGFHLALVDRRQLVELGSAGTPEEAAMLVASWLPRLVAVDSPRRPAPAGHRSRAGEREFMKAGICSIRYTPDRARLAANPRYYEWVEHGLELYEALEKAGLRTIECFPTASWTRWAGTRSTMRRSAWSRAALAAFELDGIPERLSQDSRDAIGAALTARAHAAGDTETFGDIVVPKSPIELKRRRSSSWTENRNASTSAMTSRS
jgi:predicted nuclease with RNAse H fold